MSSAFSTICWIVSAEASLALAILMDCFSERSAAEGPRPTVFRPRDSLSFCSLQNGACAFCGYHIQQTFPISRGMQRLGICSIRREVSAEWLCAAPFLPACFSLPAPCLKRFHFCEVCCFFLIVFFCINCLQRGRRIVRIHHYWFELIFILSSSP